MTAASGLQIAFLIFAFEFFAMLAARALLPALGWPAERLNFVGQLVTFSAAAILLAGHRGLRRQCAEMLRVPLPAGSPIDIAAMTIINLSVPFAIVGAYVIHAFASGTVTELPERITLIDPALAWEIALSPWKLVQTIVLSCLVGPIVEELVFRGFLYRALERRYGWLRSLALTSIVFGVAHPTHMVSAALGSVLMVCLLRRTGSLRAPILAHMAFNILISWPLFGQLLLSTPRESIYSLTTWALPLGCLVFAIAAVPAYVIMSREGIDAADAVRAGAR